jgi:hypothetical protein
MPWQAAKIAAPASPQLAPALTQSARLPSRCPSPLFFPSIFHSVLYVLKRESWLGEFGQRGKWSYCLPAAKMAAEQEST